MGPDMPDSDRDADKVANSLVALYMPSVPERPIKATVGAQALLTLRLLGFAGDQGRVDDWSGASLYSPFRAQTILFTTPVGRRKTYERNPELLALGKHYRFQSSSAALEMFYLFIFW